MNESTKTKIAMTTVAGLLTLCVGTIATTDYSIRKERQKHTTYQGTPAAIQATEHVANMKGIGGLEGKVEKITLYELQAKKGGHIYEAAITIADKGTYHIFGLDADNNGSIKDKNDTFQIGHDRKSVTFIEGKVRVYEGGTFNTKKNIIYSPADPQYKDMLQEMEQRKGYAVDAFMDLMKLGREYTAAENKRQAQNEIFGK